MEIKRASEIFDSLGVIDVNYKGIPVWIEQLNKENNEARVKDLNTDREISVNISELEES